MPKGDAYEGLCRDNYSLRSNRTPYIPNTQSRRILMDIASALKEIRESKPGLFDEIKRILAKEAE